MRMDNASRREFESALKNDMAHDWGDELPAAGDELIDLGTAMNRGLGRIAVRVYCRDDNDFVSFVDSDTNGWWLWRWGPKPRPVILRPQLLTRGGHPVSHLETHADHFAARIEVKGRVIQARFTRDGYFYRSGVETPMDLVETQ